MPADIRKTLLHVEKTTVEGNKKAQKPLILIAAAAVIKNPWIDLENPNQFIDDLKPGILDVAPGLGEMLTSMIINEAGSGANVEGYGKSAVVGLKGVAYMSAYGAAKAGLINFTRATAIEAAPHVRVNCIIPGAVMTPATKRAIPDDKLMEATANTIPLKRIAEPAELAKPIAFLLSSDASFITGASLVVDGGKTADLNAGN